ncbi:MAG: pseudouridine synthase, partial [Gaiellaceae bacterium]
MNAYLARAGVASRRGADTLIEEGRVELNGVVAMPGVMVQAGDEVMLDGLPLAPQRPVYVLLHKPAGTITTARDPQGRPTVVDLVDREERVFPVGRLDADTTGALLLTNDGVLAHRLAHPRYEVDKVYVATVAEAPARASIVMLETGLDLDDGRTAPAQARILDESGRRPITVELIVHEGRKHQVKRMLAAVGHPVISLHRSRYATLTLEGLPPGDWRELTDAE